MDTNDSPEPEREFFIQFPKPHKENRSNGERWHLLVNRVPQAEIVYFCHYPHIHHKLVASKRKQ